MVLTNTICQIFMFSSLWEIKSACIILNGLEPLMLLAQSLSCLDYGHTSLKLAHLWFFGVGLLFSEHEL